MIGARHGLSLLDPPNARMYRAKSVVAQVMRIVGPYLSELDDRRHYEAQQRGEDSPSAPHSQVHQELMSALMELGVEVVTDLDRESIGLPARSPNGWTAEELLTLERRRLEAMQALIPPLMVLDVASGKVSPADCGVTQKANP